MILNPVLLNEQQILKVFRSIRDYLKDTYFNVIQDIYKSKFNVNIRFNEVSNELLKAFKDNKLTYNNGFISGQFNSKLSKQLIDLGAIYNARKRVFEIDILPSELLNVVYNNQNKTNSFVYDLDDFTNEYLKNLENSIDLFNLDYSGVIDNYFNQLNFNFKDIGIKPVLNEYQVKALNDNYINNSKSYLFNFVNKDITKLREQLKNYVLDEGYSNKTIADYIQKTYNTTQRHSLFLARQESNLILAEYTESQYRSMGFKKYMWLTSNDERVRNYPINNNTGGNHKMLNRKVFSFDDPPVVNLLTGERANPGQSVNCRCVSSVIID